MGNMVKSEVLWKWLPYVTLRASRFCRKVCVKLLQNNERRKLLMIDLHEANCRASRFEVFCGISMTHIVYYQLIWLKKYIRVFS